ncbi:MAG: peptide chain release factor N(5)-glutamine methyltransferase [Zetaproteobacteria bacterium CG06_land_8_20_14_3_00_59_53]|nr:MAG: protein-(glutamine-N5) methyltransferase, release factor-specific [Zetaproteobacteria bacterium CG2_30_59_37]PIO89664.1 MAG: protein-(glutamine-N5) methyltransferase, release factor-specific [Zetaproteobacteria bacterium CG23_combo_of_CG06-09_8_20_14_all_59_86]PIQ65734.1 MAG: protein-(glutamine-N5) methyltransferase, release factor-specific [Zetaproteobacteria bacterium CG11_big_fil_rev_8_21_14_0_20_59_439]PIU70075.1 MAG: peptide chain release factor N(5)-glutamine methyltransferase [Zet
MSPRRLLAQAVKTLVLSGCTSPKLDAELLLCHVLGKGRSWLIAHADDAINASTIDIFLTLLERRRLREPVAYITGEKEFWSRPFHVSPDVLIPRPETEHLIEALLTHLPDTRAAHRFCDIGTGSGIIAVTLACEYPNAHVVATDISTAALAVAASNAERHGVAERMEFFQGDIFGALKGSMEAFDAIVSNPPYVAEHEMAALEAELGFEPRSALTDGVDGLRYLSELVAGSRARLKQDGLLIVETGLCGLPEGTEDLPLKQRITDLAGRLRGGIYTR